MNVLVVGSGISGATKARLLAERGDRVTVIDQRETIAGNCYDYFDESGIDVHKYGTHIFHTDTKKVWDFVSRFTDWYPYQHKVLALVDGQLVPIPFNLNSIRTLFPSVLAQRLECKLVEQFGFNVKVPILKLRQTGDDDLLFLAKYVYEKVFLHYTLKQWALKPEDLDPSVTARVPVYISRDDRYFQNRYQGIPLSGYTSLISNMLKHERISVKLSERFTHSMQKKYDHIFYTGPIDEYFNYCFGELPYRSLRFKFIKFEQPYFQSNSVINYPSNYDFTRIGEYKYFLPTKSSSTIVSFEYPENFVCGENERYYPVPSDQSCRLYERYRIEALKISDKLTFLGRLGAYRYYDMDQAVGAALGF